MNIEITWSILPLRHLMLKEWIQVSGLTYLPGECSSLHYRWLQAVHPLQNSNTDLNSFTLCFCVVHVRLHVSVYVQCVEARLDVFWDFPNCFLPYVLRKHSQRTWSSPIWLTWMGPFASTFPELGFKCVPLCPEFYVATGEPTPFTDLLTKTSQSAHHIYFLSSISSKMKPLTFHWSIFVLFRCKCMSIKS